MKENFQRLCLSKVPSIVRFGSLALSPTGLRTHRGAGKLAPENTLSAFRLGASHGFAANFECDVTLSADGEAYLLHDPKLDRTTDGQGVAVERNWADLSYLRRRQLAQPRHMRRPLLRLGALSRWLQANQLMVNLEIKPGPGDDVRCGEVVANEVARLWMGAAWFSLCLAHSRWMLYARRKGPSLTYRERCC